MPVLYWREPDKPRRLPTTFFYVGLTLYAFSFLLPAIKDSGGLHPGWTCAWLALLACSVKEVNGLAFFGGLINPVALAYIVLRILDRAPEARFLLVLAVLTFIPITWLSLITMHLGIWIGHIAWIAGLLLIIDWKDLQSLRRNSH